MKSGKSNKQIWNLDNEARGWLQKSWPGEDGCRKAGQTRWLQKALKACDLSNQIIDPGLQKALLTILRERYSRTIYVI